MPVYKILDNKHTIRFSSFYLLNLKNKKSEKLLTSADSMKPFPAFVSLRNRHLSNYSYYESFGHRYDTTDFLYRNDLPEFMKRAFSYYDV